jgi:hypothetical protein
MTRRLAVKTRTVCLYPIVAALKAAEAFLGSNRTWNAINDTQKRFLETVAHCRGNRLLEIESVASSSADEINAWLKKRGFGVALEPFSEEAFGIAAVLKMVVEWMKKGVRTIIDRNGVKYSAVEMKSEVGDENVLFYTSLNHDQPVVGVKTKTGERVYMTVADTLPENDINMFRAVTRIARTLRLAFDFDRVTFPMVDLDQEVDISWLQGLRTIGEDDLPGVISQALQQTKLKMNEVGAKIESAVAVSVMRGMSKPKKHLVIDRPFVFWVERSNLGMPIFVGHVCEDAWKDPDTIA